MHLRLPLAFLFLLGACSSERTRPGTAPCTSWREDVEPAFQARCQGCHGGSEPAGGVDLGTYAGVIAVASRLVEVIGPGVAPPHDALADLQPMLRSWVDECHLSYFRSDLHPGGIMNPADPQFHGELLRGLGWDLGECARCHGDDFSGGSSGASCLGCHTEGPTACTTCHGTPPASGGHLAHGPCQECHTTPEVWNAPGHLDGVVGVTFGPFAALDPFPERREGPPAWDKASGTCRNVYCHGDPFADSTARYPEPAWTAGPSQGECGACHGLPPSDHAPGAGACEACHGPFEPDLHIDGAVRIGDGSGTCSACHGDAESPAPTDGGHRSHVFASHLSGPVACNSCHAVPATVTAPGHIDSGPPAEVSFPGWDRTTQTCAVWCHGSFQPDWTSIGTGEAACATCHGIPPATAAHDASMTLTDCAGCHAATVDAFGNIRIVGGVSTHIDGDVDFD